MPPARARGRAVSRQTAGNRRCEPRSRRETSSFPRRSTPWEASRSPPPGRNRTARRRSDRHSAPSATPSSGSRQLWHRRTILSPLWFRLCRLRVSKRKPLLPIFEAVSNSLDAIADRRRPGTIRVTVLRQPELLDSSRGAPHTFIVEDNGIGFNDENMAAFDELYSERKIRHG